jgi:large subunit ribosomal protein L29
MKRLKTGDLQKQEAKDLISRLDDLRSELSRLRSSAARGTIKKDTGEVKAVRRNIARVLTVINSKKVPAVEQENSDKKKKEEQ